MEFAFKINLFINASQLSVSIALNIFGSIGLKKVNRFEVKLI